MKQYLSTVIVKPVDNLCNLSCSYCYVKKQTMGRAPKSIMDFHTLEALVNFFCTAHECIEFIWHGGEPLLAGIDFYAKVVELQASWRDRGKSIFNSIQTNGTLINDDWVALFSANQFKVGVSLDGFPSAHDALRTYPSGAGSFHHVMRGINYLRERELFTGIICCVSSANYRQANEVLDFLVSHDIKKMKFNRIRGTGWDGNPLPGSISPQQYAEFLLSIFRAWVTYDDISIEIRELNSLVNLLLGGDLRECVFSGACYRYCTVTSDGSIYACDSLPMINELHFGHITADPGAVIHSRAIHHFEDAAARIRQNCAHCEWFSLCRGGCLQDWVFPTSAPGIRNSACDGLKFIFSSIQNELKDYGLI
jgi:uncharacterized protein